MRILIFSDSHNDYKNMSLVLDKLDNEIDYIIHLGDHFSDAEAVKYNYPDFNIKYVRGNCDYAPNAPNDELIEICGYKLFITHGHLYSVKSTYSNIITAAKTRKADICLFGHTHIPDVFYNEKTLFLNPGSISKYRCKNNPSYGILNIENDKVIPSVAERINDVYKPIKISARNVVL